MKLAAAACLGFCLGLAGCASTKVDTSGAGAGRPLCQPAGQRLSALVVWHPQWRHDQKDVAAREAAAQSGIEQFFAGSGCFAAAEVQRGAVIPPRPAADRVIAITVRELGPVIRLLASPALVEGGTEVVLEVKVLGRGGEPLADLHTHWQNGGAFVIKGTRTLAQDMSAALAAALAF